MNQYNKSLLASLSSSVSSLNSKLIRVSVGETSNVRNFEKFSRGKLESKNVQKNIMGKDNKNGKKNINPENIFMSLNLIPEAN